MRDTEIHVYNCVLDELRNSTSTVSKKIPALHVIYTLKVTIFASDGTKKKKKNVCAFFPP